MRKLDASDWFSAISASSAIPDDIDVDTEDVNVFNYSKWQRSIAYFGDVLAFCKENDIWMNVEIKPAEGHDADTGRIVAKYTKKKFLPEIEELQKNLESFQFQKVSKCISNLPLMSSFSYDALMAAKLQAPELPRAFLIDNLEVTIDWREKMVQLGAVAIHTNAKFLTEILADDIKALGYGLFCYTVNTKKEADKLTSWGVDSFCTDELNMFSQFSKKVPSRNLLSEILSDIGGVEEV